MFHHVGLVRPLGKKLNTTRPEVNIAASSVKLNGALGSPVECVVRFPCVACSVVKKSPRHREIGGESRICRFAVLTQYTHYTFPKQYAVRFPLPIITSRDFNLIVGQELKMDMV
jgi:hypothetical protein